MERLVPARQKVRNRRNVGSQASASGRSASATSAAQAAQVNATLRRERVTFAAKVRGARSILGWSQRELGARVSMTQKSIYLMELGTHDLRRSTVVMVEQVLKAEGIEFEELPSGGFKVVVPEVILLKLVRAAGEAARTRKN
jgi:ribosome-binding protein aMBF1 (putative translation factor)